MKKCPFCAEEIQEEAIKCRYCSSFLNKTSVEGSTGKIKPDSIAEPDTQSSFARSLLVPAISDPPQTPSLSLRKVLYAGCPSWRAYFKEYVGILLLSGALLPALLFWMGRRFEVRGTAHILMVTIPLLVAVLVFFALQHYRHSKIFRVTSSNIEVEHGFLSKKIDVLELWRCRDIRFRQSFFDRILAISHIEIYTTDVTTPNICIVGMPASRELFANIRDAIEIQRQSRNVVGMIQ